MRAQVKRYNAGLSGMVGAEHGSWVHADDYDALAARLAAHDLWLREMCEDYKLSSDDHAASRRTAINELIHDLRDRLAAAERERDAAIRKWTAETDALAAKINWCCEHGHQQHVRGSPECLRMQERTP